MRILLVGFSEEEIERIKGLGYDVLPVPEHLRDIKVRELLNRREGGNYLWTEQRFVIMHEPTNEDIKTVMKNVRELIGREVIFATTTETNLNWTLEELLEELKAEDEYFRAMREARKIVKERRGLFLDIGNVK
ncbi:DUF3783 domain-containing protein [Thermococcus sp.]